MYVSEEDRRGLALLGRLAIFEFIVVPVVLLVVASLLPRSWETIGGEARLMVYILFVISLVEPLLYHVIERSILSRQRRNAARAQTPGGLFRSLALIRMSLVMPIYIYGFVAFLVTGWWDALLSFYALAAVWCVVVWPRESHFRRLLERLEGP